MHGGLSPDLENPKQQIRDIERPTEVPEDGLLCDLLWSDPADTEEQWEDNDRGVSYTFNQEVL